MAQPIPLPVVLLVDDEELALTLRKTVLEAQGFEVLAARNSREAVELFQANSISVVMTDHLLHGESGVQLAHDLKRLNPAIPVVMLSGMAPESMDDIDLFLIKGTPVPEVIDALRKVLAEHQQGA